MSPPVLAATICRTTSAEFQPLAKRVTLNGEGGFRVQGYSKALWFTFEIFQCPDIVAFGRELARLAKDPAAGVLRGAPLPHVRSKGCYYRRALSAETETNSIAEAPRAWIAIDVDDVPAPSGMPNWLADIPAAARYLVQLLPPELHDVRGIAQITGSAGFSGDRLLRLRLWYALDRALGCAEVKRWAQAWNHAQGSRLIDPAIYTPVALNYTATPILGVGVKAPLVERWHLVEGQQDRAVLVVPPAATVPMFEPSLTRVAVDSTNGAATRRRSFPELVGLIGTPEFGFYEPIISALGRGAADGQDPEPTLRAVMDAVLKADPGHRDRPTILRYADRGFLEKAFNSFNRQDAKLRQANEALYQHWFRSGPAVSQARQNQTGGQREKSQ